MKFKTALTAPFAVRTMILAMAVTFILFVILALIWGGVSKALADSIDNDALLGFAWNPPPNEWSVEYYDVEYWASGFGPQGGTLTSDTTFVVIDVMSWLPGINQMDSVKVRGVNSWGDVGPWSDAAEPVQIHIIPEVPGRPYWVEENQ